MTEPSAFSGFSAEGLQFLRDLAANNDRAWFQPRKADYERLIKEPLEELCAALGDRFARLDVPLEADPIRSPFRIYRDVRFSKDKSPYKTYISASFPWIGEGRGVGGYFSLSPGDAYVGGGMWHPEPTRLGAWRSAVAERPRAVHAALRDAARHRYPPLADRPRGSLQRRGHGDRHHASRPGSQGAIRRRNERSGQSDCRAGPALALVSGLPRGLPDHRHHLAEPSGIRRQDPALRQPPALAEPCLATRDRHAPVSDRATGCLPGRGWRAGLDRRRRVRAPLG